VTWSFERLAFFYGKEVVKLAKFLSYLPEATICPLCGLLPVG
jgi:hypothetical protein